MIRCYCGSGGPLVVTGDGVFGSFVLCLCGRMTLVGKYEARGLPRRGKFDERGRVFEMHPNRCDGPYYVEQELRVELGLGDGWKTGRERIG